MRNQALRDAGYRGRLLPERPRGSGSGGSSGRSSEGPQTPGGPNRLSLDNVNGKEGPPYSKFFSAASTATRSLEKNLRNKIVDVIKTVPHPAGSPSGPTPLGPMTGSLGLFRPLK